MYQKEKNKKMLNIIIVFLIILIVLCVILILYKNNLENSDRIPDDLEYINGVNEDNEETYEYPYMAYMLFIKYKGNINSDDIVESMSYFANQIIPNYYLEFKDVTDSEIIEYYDKNKTTISMDVGIENEIDFKSLILKLQNLNGSNLKFKSYRIDENSIISKTNYVTCDFYIEYENNEEIGFNVKIYNTKKEDSSSLVYTVNRDS